MNFNDEEFLNRLKTLTPKELKYFKLMKPRSGVLYIKSKPGIGKSAIAKAIANKLEFQYIDLRLSMLDETDIGLYPNKETTDDGNNCLKYIVPEWAIKANQKPTIIHFEELNRAQLNIRNAALQILLERCIGYDFCFNDNVFMLSSGNLGEADGTDVEEFDAALNNRLIHVEHKLEYSEWVDAFAKEHIHPLILSYLDNRPSEYYKKGKDTDSAYATPRTWTFLSDYIISNYGKDSTANDIIDDIGVIAEGYIGNCASGFFKYLEDLKMVSIKDVLMRYDEVKDIINELGRSKKSELLNELKSLKFNDIKKKELTNVFAFLKNINADELTGFLINIVDNKEFRDNISNKKTNYHDISEEFKKELNGIYDKSCKLIEDFKID